MKVSRLSANPNRATVLRENSNPNQKICMLGSLTSTKMLFNLKECSPMSLPAGREVHTIVTCSVQVTLHLFAKQPSFLDDGVLLGDSGYACSPFLMTPYTTTRNAAQEAYNDAHAKTRVVIGRWKRRFHVLHSEIRMAPEKVCMIVGACAVLHNIALQLHELMEDEEVEELADVDPYHGPQQGLS